MNISTISGSSSYSYDTSTKKKSAEDVMSQAISKIQSSDPKLASKLSEMQKKVDSMKKSGSSEKDIQSTVKSTIDGLSDSEKSTFQSAMPKGGPGGKMGVGGAGRPSGPPPSGPPPSGGAQKSSDSSSFWDSDSDDSSSSSSYSFNASSLLNSASSMQNDSIMGYLSTKESSTKN